MTQDCDGIMDQGQKFEVGQTIELSDGRTAVVRFVGTTAFSSGDWVGIELPDASGKNNGTVQGEQYFQCEPGYGMFIRPAAATIIEAAPPKTNGRATGLASRTRPQSAALGSTATKRRSLAGGSAVRGRGNVTPASPSPAPRSMPGSRISRSPTKSPMKPSAASTTTTGSRTSTVPTTTRTRPSISGRPSLSSRPLPNATTASRTSRQTTLGSVDRGRPTGPTTPQNARISSDRLSLRSSTKTEPGKRLQEEKKEETRDGSEGPKEDGGHTKGTPSPSDGPQHQKSSNVRPGAAKPATSNSRPTAPRASTSGPAAIREVEDLKTKLRMMEKKRMEDREKLKTFDTIQSERDKFENIIQKLQAKYQPQQQEVVDLKRQLKESEARMEEVEKRSAEHDVVVEMATLDREMAEETAESLRVELEAVKSKAEEFELELDILREENEELGKEISPEEKTSQSWIHMEKNNVRLRDALIRLREMTQQQEADLQDQVKGLEDDVQDLSGFKEQYEITKERLLQTEADIEDVRGQLETALGAEDMIEELTERNMNLTERIEELKLTIEDLESLKELNDELEYNHVENEKQMQEEIDFKENYVVEIAKKNAQLEETVDDSEYTISRFRELVTNLQSDLEDLRASQQITETEAEELTSRSRAMMDLNMKLQVSASKTQVKAIDLELRRLDAQQAAEHLAIVQLFLPESFSGDRDSVLALLRFKRVAFKAQLIHDHTKERIIGQSNQIADEEVFAACDMMDKLIWVSSMCERYVNSVSGCSIERFAKFEGALYELEPVERALNSWIDELRRGELKERQCARELQRSMALMSHLAEVHIEDSLECYADEIVMKVGLSQSHLESTAFALSKIRTTVQSKIEVSEENSEILDRFYKRNESLVSICRSAKVVTTKIARALEEARSRSLSLNPDTASAFDQCQMAAQELASYSRSAGEAIHSLFSTEGRTEPFTFEEVKSALLQSPQDAFFQTEESDIFEAFGGKLRSLANNLGEVLNMASDLGLTVEFERGPAPWVARSEEIKSSKLVSIDAETELKKLKDDSHERLMQLRMREKSLEEANVKIELLESRTRDVTKKTERIQELERSTSDAKAQIHELLQSIETRTREVHNLEHDLQRFKKAADEGRILSNAAGEAAMDSQVSEQTAAVAARQIEPLRHEIESLQSTVRYLQEENHRRSIETRYGMGPSLLVGSSNAWLAEPLVPVKSSQERHVSRLRSEGIDIFHELIHLVESSSVVDMSCRAKQGNHLAWRKSSETPTYQIVSQAEDWERWREWKDDVISRGKEHVRSTGHTRRRVATPERRRKTHVARPSNASVGSPPGPQKLGSYAFGASQVQIVDNDGQDRIENA